MSSEYHAEDAAVLKFVYSLSVKMSANLQWQCIRKSSKFVLQKNGITFNTVSVMSYP